MRQHFFACPSQELAFATGKTSKPAPRNFLEEWIDFLSNELARAHGGNISLVSTGPQGTTFRIEIPDR